MSLFNTFYPKIGDCCNNGTADSNQRGMNNTIRFQQKFHEFSYKQNCRNG